MSVPRDYIRSELYSAHLTVVGQLDHPLLFSECGLKSRIMESLITTSFHLQPLWQLFSTRTHSTLTHRTKNRTKKTLCFTGFFFFPNVKLAFSDVN